MLFKIPDPKYKLFLDTDKHIAKIIKPNTIPLQVFKDLWHSYLSKDYIEKCIGEKLKSSNYITRQVHWVKTIDGEEGFIPIPRYAPRAMFKKDANPTIYYIYKVDSQGVFYFK